MWKYEEKWKFELANSLVSDYLFGFLSWQHLHSKLLTFQPCWDFGRFAPLTFLWILSCFLRSALHSFLYIRKKLDDAAHDSTREQTFYCQLFLSLPFKLENDKLQLHGSVFLLQLFPKNDGALTEKRTNVNTRRTEHVTRYLIGPIFRRIMYGNATKPHVCNYWLYAR